MLPIAGIVAGVAGNMFGGAAGGGAFETALSLASSMFGGGGGAADLTQQINQKISEGAVGVMGPMMMKLANDVLNEGLEDDGE
jgi:hypothetical protein